MSEIMKWEDMKRQFKDEWVLIENPETTEANVVTRGKVIWHGKDREELWRTASKLHLNYIAVLYTGRIPKDTAIIL
jgi:hypothetical protein